MNGSFLEALAGSGAALDPISSRPLHFGDPAGELGAALETCALLDRSVHGRILGTGRDLLDLLHRLSTQDLRGLRPGEGRPTVLTTPKGRIVERLFVHHLGEEGVLLVAGPGGAVRVPAHVERYTFGEETGLSDHTGSTVQLVLVGPRALEAAARAGLPPPARFASAGAELDGGRVRVLGEDGLSGEGISVVAPAERAAVTWRALVRAVRGVDGRPAGDEPFEAWRVLRGLGEAGRELTEDHNPLEAGLWEAVSFTKGCYVGQEVVARLNTYDKVSRHLLGLLFPEGAAAPPPGTVLLVEGREVGRLTSVAIPPGRRAAVGLAYVKRDAARTGGSVRAGAGDAAPSAILVGLPFGPTP